MSSIGSVGANIAPVIQPKPVAPVTPQQPTKPVAPKAEVENDGDKDDGGKGISA